MAKIHFHKMHAAGNDFILFDNTSGIFQGNEFTIFQKMCAPHTGIGANGVMLLERSDDADFNLKYYNSDGSSAGMCGNGVRCAVSLANKLGLAPQSCAFKIDNEIYNAELLDEGWVRLQMHQPETLLSLSDTMPILSGNFKKAIWLFTGVPHLVIETIQPLDKLDITHWGRYYRNHQKFKPSGTNINFISLAEPNNLKARVYERGVEDETLSCGSGAVASAVFANQVYEWDSPISIHFPGGILRVEFEANYNKIFLAGPVERAFEGESEKSYFE